MGPCSLVFFCFNLGVWLPSVIRVSVVRGGGYFASDLRQSELVIDAEESDVPTWKTLRGFSGADAELIFRH